MVVVTVHGGAGASVHFIRNFFTYCQVRKQSLSQQEKRISPLKLIPRFCFCLLGHMSQKL